LTTDLLDVGLYTLPEAARLTGVPSAHIRRWTLGYHFVREGTRRWSPPLVTPKLHPMEGELAVTFLDLQELRFLHAFRTHGMSWYWLRIYHDRAKERVGHDRPFSTGKFKSFGRSILMEVAPSSRRAVLEDVVSSQLGFKKVIAPFLRGVVFEKDRAVRWFPRPDKRVVVDPTQSFGQPVVTRGGVPTNVLAHSYKAERSMDRVARWYAVDIRSVRAAVEFERRLAA
jgi:uncharacterized protein (DUF433 family)